MLTSMPWKWKLWLLNAAGMTYFFLLTFGSLFIGLFITLPEVYSDTPELLWRRRLLACYVAVIILLNFFCLRHYSKDSYVKGKNCVLPTSNVTVSDAKVCRTCEIPTPARAKHCPLCGVCVLKRDHHCFFGGCCIGFHNQRYFIVFCFYVMLGAVYSTWAVFSYLSLHYYSVLSSQFYQHLIPWLFYNWLTGHTPINICAMALFGYFSVMTCFGGAFYFASQCFLLCVGQTSYEYMKGIKKYQYPVLEHVRYVFGPWWGLNFIVPLPFLKQHHNGVDWRIEHCFKDC
jgi:palmitoyltransferase